MLSSHLYLFSLKNIFFLFYKFLCNIKDVLNTHTHDRLYYHNTNNYYYILLGIFIFKALHIYIIHLKQCRAESPSFIVTNLIGEKERIIMLYCISFINDEIKHCLPGVYWHFFPLIENLPRPKQYARYLTPVNSFNKPNTSADIPLCPFTGRLISSYCVMIWYHKNKNRSISSLANEKACSTYGHSIESCKDGSYLRRECHHFKVLNISRNWATENEKTQAAWTGWGAGVVSESPGCWSCPLSVTLFLLYTHTQTPSETDCREISR